MPPSQLLQLQLEDDINFWEKEMIIVYVGHYDENPSIFKLSVLACLLRRVNIYLKPLQVFLTNFRHQNVQAAISPLS